MRQFKLPLTCLGRLVTSVLLVLALLLFASFAEAQNVGARLLSLSKDVPASTNEDPCDTSTLPSQGAILAAHEALYTRCLVWSPINMGAIWMAITIEHGYVMRPPIGTLWSGSNAYRHGEEWWYEHRGLPRSDRAEACLQNLVLATRAAHCGGPED